MRCEQCLVQIEVNKRGAKRKSNLCDKCRVKKWHLEHKERVAEIKREYVIKNPEKRKESWDKYNRTQVEKRSKSNARWYDKFNFSGKRALLISIHPYCERCKRDDRPLHVHHRDGNGVGKLIKNNSWNNLLVLCNSCHKTVHNNKEYPYYVGK